MRRLTTVLVALPLVVRAEPPADDTSNLAPSTVRLRADGETLVMSAHFAMKAPAGVTDFMFEVPDDAAVTGASVTIDGIIHRLALTRAEPASEKLADAAGGELDETVPRAAMALLATTSGQPTLNLLLPAAASAQLDLELSGPTCFDGDVRYMQVPAAWYAATDPAFRRKPSDETIQRCGGGESWVGFASRDLAARPGGDARIGATAGRLAADQLHLAHVELDLAGKLAEVPGDLATVLLIDNSRSMTRGDLDAQRLLVESYIRDAGATRVQVVEYARTARAVLPAWTSTTVALPRLDRELRALATRNGSNVDVGLAEAGRWLARIDGTRRVVLITDEHLAERVAQLDQAALAKLVPAGTMIHVVAIAASDAIERVDDATFGPLAHATHGIAVMGGAGEDTPHAATMLVRPIALDQVTVRAQGWKSSERMLDRCEVSSTDPGILPEGHSCSWWFEGTALSGPIVIEGKLWDQPVTRTLRPDPTRATAMAREIIAATATFDEEAQTKIEALARAVSNGWSLLGSWGGSGGYELFGPGGFGTSGWGGCCDTGNIGTIGHGTMGTGISPLDITFQLRNSLRACNAERARVEVTLETTLEEVVGVTVKLRSHDAAMATCIEEAIWNTALAIQNPPSHQTRELVIGPL